MFGGTSEHTDRAGEQPSMAQGADQQAIDPDGRLDAAQVPEPPLTGDPAVDEAVARVAAAMTHPLAEQVHAYDAVHQALQDRLADVED